MLSGSEIYILSKIVNWNFLNWNCFFAGLHRYKTNLLLNRRLPSGVLYFKFDMTLISNSPFKKKNGLWGRCFLSESSFTTFKHQSAIHFYIIFILWIICKKIHSRSSKNTETILCRISNYFIHIIFQTKKFQVQMK
jgi:hypothetical protein